MTIYLWHTYRLNCCGNELPDYDPTAMHRATHRDRYRSKNASRLSAVECGADATMSAIVSPTAQPWA